MGAMKTTNQLLSAICRARRADSPSECEDGIAETAFPFSRRTELGACDIATNGHVLVAIFGRGEHYSREAGPPLHNVFVKDDGGMIAIAGEKVAISVRGLRSWCKDALAVEGGVEGRRFKVRPLHLVAVKAEVQHDVVVDADHLLSVLAFLRGDVTLTIGRHCAGLSSLDVVGLKGLPWDDSPGEVRALVMPMRHDVLSTTPRAELLPPPGTGYAFASAL